MCYFMLYIAPYLKLKIMKANRTAHRFMYLLAIMAGAFTNPLKNQSLDPKDARREFHLTWGANPMFSPRNKKRKGYMKQEGRKKGYHKFQKH